MLRPCWGLLLAVFLYYCRLRAPPHPPSSSRLSAWGFLQLALDGNAITKVFTTDRVRATFDYSASLEGDGASEEAEEEGVASGGGQRARVPAGEEGGRGEEGSLSFAGFLGALIRFGFERANPKWTRDSTGRLNAPSPPYMVPVEEGAARFLSNCVCRFCHRDASYERSARSA